MACLVRAAIVLALLAACARAPGGRAERLPAPEVSVPAPRTPPIPPDRGASAAPGGGPIPLADPVPASAARESAPGEGRVFTVRVVDESGVPVEGVEVHARDQRDSTAEDGTVRLLPRRLPSTVSATPAEDAPLVPGATTRVEVDGCTIVLKAATPIAGKVFDEDWRPIAGVRVSAGWPLTFTTDAEGAFTGKVAVAGKARLEIRSWDWEATLSEVAPGARDLVVRARRIPREGTLLVRVVDWTGAPVAGAEVQFRGATPVTTDVAGRARLESLRCVADRLQAAPPRALRDTHYGCWVGDVRPEGQEVVCVLEEACVVSGTVRLADGRAPDDASVSVRGMRHGWGSTCRGGAFRAVMRRAEAPFRVHAWAPDGYAASLRAVAEDVAPDTTDLQLVLR